MKVAKAKLNSNASYKKQKDICVKNYENKFLGEKTKWQTSA